MPTAPSCRCSDLAEAGPGTRGSGPLSGTIDHSTVRILLQYSTATPPIARATILARIWPRSGVLQADGYAGFGGLYADGRVMEAACWAHARRKLFDVHEATGSPLACEALDRIAALCRVEELARGRPPDDRLRLRGEKAAAIKSELQTWLSHALSHLRPQRTRQRRSAMRSGAGDGLAQILRDGHACIDNSAAERAMLQH